MMDWMRLAPDGKPYWIISKDCPNLIRTIPEMEPAEHDIDDMNCFVAGTKVTTINGDKNIEDVKVGDLVLTPIGYRKVIKDGISGRAKTTEAVFNDGRKLRGTLDHRVFVKGKGLIELQFLEKHDILIEKNTSQLCQLKKLFTEVAYIVDMKVGSTIQTAEDHSTGKFTKTILGRFQMVITSIIKITITMTTVSGTWKWLIGTIMLDIILKTERILGGIKKSGGQVKGVKKSLEKMLEKCTNEHQKDGSRASIVKSLLTQPTRQRDFVTTIAEKIVRRLKSVLFAEKGKHGKTPLVHIIVAGNSGEETVYNLTVEDAHLYYANGFLVTNTNLEDHAVDSASFGLNNIKFVDVGIQEVPRGGESEIKGSLQEEVEAWDDE